MDLVAPTNNKLYYFTQNNNWNVSSEMECLGCVEIYGLIVITSDIKGSFFCLSLELMMVMGYELSAHFT